MEEGDPGAGIASVRGKTGDPKPVAGHQRPEKLFSKISNLKMELDWLKKSPGSACHETSILDQAK